MAKKLKQKITLFFIEDARATEAEMEAAEEFQPGVQFRNARYVADTGALEAFDRLAGAIPPRYQAALDVREGREVPVEPEAAPVDRSTAMIPALPVKAVKPPVPKPGAGWSGNT